jgi:hypothetical protein
VIILEKISSFMTHVEQMDTTSSLNSQVQELPNIITRWNESFKPFMGRLEQHDLFFQMIFFVLFTKNCSLANHGEKE